MNSTYEAKVYHYSPLNGECLIIHNYYHANQLPLDWLMYSEGDIMNHLSKLIEDNLISEQFENFTISIKAIDNVIKVPVDLSSFKDNYIRFKEFN